MNLASGASRITHKRLTAGYALTEIGKDLFGASLFTDYYGRIAKYEPYGVW